jgi:hypothetical protein
VGVPLYKSYEQRKNYKQKKKTSRIENMIHCDPKGKQKLYTNFMYIANLCAWNAQSNHVIPAVIACKNQVDS